MGFCFKLKSFMLQDFKDNIKNLNLKINIDVIRIIMGVYLI